MSERGAAYFANTSEQNDWIILAQRQGVDEAVKQLENWIETEDRRLADEAAARGMVEDRKAEYSYATDSESGTIDAATFEEACEQLKKLVPESAIAAGGFGWVEDSDGYRFELGEAK